MLSIRHAPKVQHNPAQGNTLGNWRIPLFALKGQYNPPFLFCPFRAFFICLRFITQGVALGWVIQGFQPLSCPFIKSGNKKSQPPKRQALRPALLHKSLVQLHLVTGTGAVQIIKDQ